MIRTITFNGREKFDNPLLQNCWYSLIASSEVLEQWNVLNDDKEAFLLPSTENYLYDRAKRDYQ